ncbi:tripartite ATP-independent transporter DctP family solute receptor [Salsuginibacillus halophilus]|uniref:Tripartite ATP-independent transporter DctP family solute receptor n=1 Tax=Salsuginibacillus halophilus TaxID=517424 RepID=A0A2P8HE27_9BACI|nr:TRAP transporter substrate-binding protein DctP [Salsuginibacillus halophilus]PSL44473.1 tripartite ATP-independent transporter DctP family solute receptor [Salsuginibacillus halophilus]
MENLKRRLMLPGFALVAGAALTACGGDEEAGGDNGGDGPEYEWDFITEETPGQVQYEYAQEYADLLNEKSDGRIEVDVFEFGGLGSEVDQLEQLQAGGVELGIVSPGFVSTLVEEAQIFSLHYLLPDDQEQTQEILNESEAVNEMLAEKYVEQGLQPLSFWTEGAMQWTGSSQLRSSEDFEGFLMRTQESPLMIESYGAYGADATPLSWEELYGGLQQGQVDGQENPIFFIEDASFHEVQDHMTISNHNSYVAVTTMNQNIYEELPEDIQEIVHETTEEMRDIGFDLQDELNEERLEMIEEDEENPTEVYELTDEEIEEFQDLARPVRDFFREEEGEEAAEILDQLEEDIAEVTGEEE